MGKRGIKPMGKVRIKWSPEFAYAIGLLATDGNLSPDGRHFDFTSQDREQLENFMSCLNIKNKITYKTSPYKRKKVSRIQFGDVNFYKFLLTIGLTPKKSKNIGAVLIPKIYFFDFLRGHFDGDGTFYSYWDPRWKSSFMFYTEFVSASRKHIDWLRGEIRKKLGIQGHITKAKESSVYQLKYAKSESLTLLPEIYIGGGVRLSRKYLKIKKVLSILGKQNLI